MPERFVGRLCSAQARLGPAEGFGRRMEGSVALLSPSPSRYGLRCQDVARTSTFEPSFFLEPLQRMSIRECGALFGHRPLCRSAAGRQHPPQHTVVIDELVFQGGDDVKQSECSENVEQ